MMPTAASSGGRLKGEYVQPYWNAQKLSEVVLVFVLLVSICECSASVTIHTASEILDASSMPTLAPTFGSISWFTGWLIELIASFFINRISKAQWYVIANNNFLHELNRIHGVSFVRSIGTDTHIVIGSTSTPLRLSSWRSVRWVGKRPDHHKLDSALLFLMGRDRTAAATSTGARNFSFKAHHGHQTHWRRVSLDEVPDEATVATIRTLVAILTLPTDGRTNELDATERLAGRWGRSFARRGWDADATAVSSDRIAVALDYSRGGGSGVGRGGSLLARVAGWLARRVDVLWVEPRASHAPAARYASKLLAFGRGTATDLKGARLPTSPAAGAGLEEIYAPSATDRSAVEAALTSPAFTGTWDVESDAGPGLSGDYCAFLPRAAPGSDGGGMVRGAAGATAGFLNVLATGKVVGATRASANVTLAAAAGTTLSGYDGAYDGMAAAFCAAQADCSAAGAANFSIVRYLAGPPAMVVLDPVWPASGAVARSPGAGQYFTIRPVLQPGDTVTFHAYAAALSVSYTPDALVAPAAAVGNPSTGASFRPPRCSAAGASAPAALAGLPTLLWGLGYRQLRSTCQPSAPVTATISLPGPPTVVAGDCAALCSGAATSPLAKGNLSALWARAGLCGPINATAGVAVGFSSGVAAGTCTCSMTQVAPRRDARPARTSRQAHARRGAHRIARGGWASGHILVTYRSRIVGMCHGPANILCRRRSHGAGSLDAPPCWCRMCVRERGREEGRNGWMDGWMDGGRETERERER